MLSPDTAAPGLREGIPLTPGERLRARRSMIESIPRSPLFTLHDTEFEIAFYGCFGNESGGVIVCVTDFAEPGSENYVYLYRAGIRGADGRSIGSGWAASESRGYRIGNDENWMPIRGGGTTRVYTQFRTTFARSGTIRLLLQLGGPFNKRNQGFPSTQIQTIRASDEEQRRLFEFP
jgi:hypothetical protein